MSSLFIDYRRHLKHTAQIQTRAIDQYGEPYVTDTTTVICLLYEEDDEHTFVDPLVQSHLFKNRVIFEPTVSATPGDLLVSVVDKDGVEVLDSGELREVEAYYHYRHGKSFVWAGVDVD